MKSSEHQKFDSLWSHSGRVLLITMVLFCLVSRLAGQSREAGEIRGTVTDATGAVVPEAKVVVTNVLTGISHTFVTDEDGVYDDNFTPNGTYSVTVSKPGFKQFVKSNVTVTQDLIGVNAVLQPGSVKETIEVYAQKNEVETESTEIHTSFTGEDITSLPMGRDPRNLTALAPGNTGGGGELSQFNGAGFLQSNWQIDGGNAFFAPNQNTNGLYPPMDSVAEVKVATANFGAEYGNGTAVINEVTKSGTNQWHGTLSEWYQSNAFNAFNAFTRLNPNYVWNQFGGTLGGPIKRNKAFFFFTYQGTRIGGEYAAYETVPTQAMRNGDFSKLGIQLYDPSTYDPTTKSRQPLSYNGQNNVIDPARIDPVAKAIQSYFPLPNVPGLKDLPNIYNNFEYTASGASSNDYYSGKLDYDITSKNRLTFTLLDTPQHAPAITPPCPMNCETYSMPFQVSTQLTDSWTITPHLANQARFTMSVYSLGYKSDTAGKGYPQKIGLANPSGDVFPTMGMSGTWGWLGIGTTNLGSAENVFERELDIVPSDMATWVKGKHIIEFGVEFDKWYNGEQWPSLQDGNFSFGGIYTNDPNPNDQNPSPGDGYADFLLGLPQAWSVYAAPYTTGINTVFQSFVSDAYKITPSLTLTVGARYLHQTGWSEAHNEVYNFNPTLINPATNTPGAVMFAPNGFTHFTNPQNFLAPRLGFAWSPFKDTSIRGGYGLYNFMQGQYGYGGANYGSGYGLADSLASQDNITPIFSFSANPGLPAGTAVGPPPVTPLPASGRTPDALNNQNIIYYKSNLHIGYSEQFQLDIEHRFAGDILATVAYVGNQGHHLPFSTSGPRDMNQVPVAHLADAMNSGNIQAYRPYPQFQSIGVEEGSDWSNYNSLQMTVKKATSHGVSVGANYTFSKALDTGTPQGGGPGYASTWQNYYNMRADYGPSPTDIRQVFHGWVTYDLPVGKGKSFLNRPGLVNEIVGGWSATFVAYLQTGSPFTPVVGTANLTYAGSGTWRPNR